MISIGFWLLLEIKGLCCRAWQDCSICKIELGPLLAARNTLIILSKWITLNNLFNY